MNDRQKELLEEKDTLQNKILELTKEKRNIDDRLMQIDIELGENNIEETYGISPKDVNKRCNRSCSDCILPCAGCHNGRCEQCGYGYITVVEKVSRKYNKTELNTLKLRCPYALLAYNK